MFHDLQESDHDEFVSRPEKRFITFSSTLSDPALAKVRHVGNYYHIGCKTASTYLSLWLMVTSALVSLWFFSSIRPDAHAVTVNDPAPAAVASPTPSPIDQTGYDLAALLSQAANYEVLPATGTNTAVGTAPDKAQDPNTIATPTVFPPTDTPFSSNGPTDVYVGGAGDAASQPVDAPDTYVFSLESDMLGTPVAAWPSSHTEMQQYADWVTQVKDFLRFIAGVFCNGVAIFAARYAIENIGNLVRSLRVKYANVPGGDLVRIIDNRGRQIGILYESMRAAVRRHNLGASHPVSESEVMDLFKESLGTEATDLLVSAYLIDTAILEEKLQIKDYPLKKQLRQQMRDIADNVVSTLLPMFIDTIYEQQETAHGEQMQQKFLEQAKSDGLMAEAQAILLGTEHLKAKIPV